MNDKLVALLTPKNGVILLGTIGLGFGAYQVFLYVQDRLRMKKLQDEVDANTPNQQPEFDWEQGQKDLAADYKSRSNGEEPLMTTVKELAKEQKIKVKPVDYQALSQKKSVNEVAKEILGDKAIPAANSKVESVNEDPEVISLDEWTNGAYNHEKVTLTFFSLDNTLADQNEQMIQNAVYLLGEDWADKFGEDSLDPDVVYIRNYRLASDFEVVRLKKSYAETVLGEPVVQKKKAAAKPGNRKIVKKVIDDDDSDA